MSLKWASTQDQPVNGFYISFHCFFQCFSLFSLILSMCFQCFSCFFCNAVLGCFIRFHWLLMFISIICHCFANVFRCVSLFLIDFHRFVEIFNVFSHACWVCLINHFFIVFSISFNVFHYFSWIFTVCFNMFIVFPCFSNVLGCVILQNEFKT